MKTLHKTIIAIQSSNLYFGVNNTKSLLSREVGLMLLVNILRKKK